MQPERRWPLAEQLLVRGWGKAHRSPIQHYFVGANSGCGLILLDQPLAADDLRTIAGEMPACCGRCVKKVERAVRRGHEVEGLLSAAEMDYIKANGAHKTTLEMAQALGRRDSLIIKTYIQHHCPKRGRGTGLFKPGHISVNKGLKGYRVPGSEKGWFKKGQMPHTLKADGVITIRNDQRGVPCKYIRLSKSNWVYLSRYTWEQAHGPIPKGHCIVFKDGDTLNCDLSNLECITRQELAIRNSGTLNLPDSMVAHHLAGGKKADPELKKALLQQPDLLNLARAQYQLQRAIKQAKGRDGQS